MPDASLLTPEVLAWAGWRSEPATVHLSPRLVERAYEAIAGDDWAGSVEPGSPAPSYAIYALQTERLRREYERPFPVLLPMSLVIGGEIWFARPLLVGESFSMVSRYDGIRERVGGRFGYAITYQFLSEFSDADGELVATISQSFMQYDAAVAVEQLGE